MRDDDDRSLSPLAVLIAGGLVVSSLGVMLFGGENGIHLNRNNPTATATPYVTSAPQATDDGNWGWSDYDDDDYVEYTPAPVVTSAPEPTSTPKPTDTPKPTNTPEPEERYWYPEGEIENISEEEVVSAEWFKTKINELTGRDIDTSSENAFAFSVRVTTRRFEGSEQPLSKVQEYCVNGEAIYSVSYEYVRKYVEKNTGEVELFYLDEPVPYSIINGNYDYEGIKEIRVDGNALAMNASSNMYAKAASGSRHI